MIDIRNTSGANEPCWFGSGGSLNGIIQLAKGCSDGNAFVSRGVQSPHSRRLMFFDPPPLKWSDLRYVFDIKEDCNGKEAIQA